MSTENPTSIIIEIKQKIQSIVSKLMSDPQTLLEDDEKKLIGQIRKYKVATNLEELSENFGNVLEPSQAQSSDSGTS